MINAQQQLVGTWTSSLDGSDNSANIARLEQGLVWITVEIQHTIDAFTSQILPDAGTGQPLTIKMPVSATLSSGTVYWWPDNAATQACVANLTAGCLYLRKAVTNADFSNTGFVTFQVGQSVTSPAGGFYQVTAGNDVALIVGVTAACVIVVLVVVVGAIYFRRNPAAWAAFKSWFASSALPLSSHRAQGSEQGQDRQAQLLVSSVVLASAGQSAAHPFPFFDHQSASPK